VLALIAVFVTTIILYQIAKLMNQNMDQIKAQAKFLSERNYQLKETQKALIVAKEQAEEANRSRTVFFSRMSHDLRTPLNGIVGTAAHLINDGAGLNFDEQQEFLVGIQRSGKHLLNVINDLLDIARLEAQQLQLHINPTSLLATCSEVVMMLRLTAESKGIDLRLQINEDVPEIVYGDEQRLQQILINLVGNGIKFTDSGEVALLVTTVAHENENDTAVATICFEVIDTGRGIAPHELEKIFDPFVQGAKDDLDTPGTGLGLAICRQLVDVMGGTLRVESTLGQGSRFWFALQLAPT
jgi:signal transduction histidine kinase